MNAAMAKAIAKEAMKQKPKLDKAEIKEKGPAPEKEPEMLVSLKKATIKEKEAPQVNMAQLEKVSLKKAVIQEKKPIETNSTPPALKLQLKKAEVKERPNIQVNTSPAVRVSLRKTPDKKIEDVDGNSTTARVSLKHREVGDKATAEKSEEPKMMINLRKPGKGRFKNLEEFYE
jgi:hypothetical protein